MLNMVVSYSTKQTTPVKKELNFPALLNESG